jgi:hypothetical protein
LGSPSSGQASVGSSSENNNVSSGFMGAGFLDYPSVLQASQGPLAIDLASSNTMFNQEILRGYDNVMCEQTDRHD